MWYKIYLWNDSYELTKLLYMTIYKYFFININKKISFHATTTAFSTGIGAPCNP